MSRPSPLPFNHLCRRVIVRLTCQLRLRLQPPAGGGVRGLHSLPTAVGGPFAEWSKQRWVPVLWFRGCWLPWVPSAAGVQAAILTRPRVRGACAPEGGVSDHRRCLRRALPPPWCGSGEGCTRGGRGPHPTEYRVGWCTNSTGSPAAQLDQPAFRQQLWWQLMCVTFGGRPEEGAPCVLHMLRLLDKGAGVQAHH